MNVDEILSALNVRRVDYLLIGGMNFLIRHRPELTFDVDIWVKDSEENLAGLNAALRDLGAEWGPDEASWRPVPEEPQWLRRQAVFCLTTQHGALDVFREVRGLEGDYDACRTRSLDSTTASGAGFRGLSDEDMLRCQEALPEGERKESRVETLRAAIAARSRNDQ